MENTRSNSRTLCLAQLCTCPMMSIQARLPEPPPLGRFIGLPWEVTVRVGAETQLGRARQPLVGWVHRSPVHCPLSALSTPRKVSPRSVCSKLLPTPLADWHLSSQKSLSRRNQDMLLKPAKLLPHHQQVLPNIKTNYFFHELSG